MIDLHCHLLPGLDDGPETPAAMLEMARALVREGVHTVCATPHSYNGIWITPPERIASACKLCQEQLRQHGIALRVLPGSEIGFGHETLALWENGQLMGVNGNRRVLLLELPNLFIAEGIALQLRRLRELGGQAIIAHPERNAMLVKQPTILEIFRYHGAHFQITAGSLSGDFGKTAAACAEYLLAKDWVEYLASDFHPGRKITLKKAFTLLGKRIGAARASLIMVDNPQKLVVENIKNTLLEKNTRTETAWFQNQSN